jgi:hypothetical protein
MAAGMGLRRSRATALSLLTKAIVAPTLYLASTQAPRSAALPADRTVDALHLQLDEAAIPDARSSSG